jgi:hypothetical protein
VTSEDVSSKGMRRLYAGVIVCEAVTIAALWLFGHVFS